MDGYDEINVLSYEFLVDAVLFHLFQFSPISMMTLPRMNIWCYILGIAHVIYGTIATKQCYPIIVGLSLTP